MAVTQRQIAQKLNLSRSLVGHALSGGTEVSAKTRELILATAREMGYDPDANVAARSMNARRHNKPLKKGTIVVMFHAMGPSLRTQPFYASFLEGIEEESARHDSTLCLCLIRIAELPRLIRERNVDGVIVLGDFPQLSAEIQALGMPVVSFHSHFEGISSVYPDDIDGARQATRYLYDQGHRRIGFIGLEGGPNNPGIYRLQGYQQVMAELGLPIRDEWMVHKYYSPQPNLVTYCEDHGHCTRCAACCSWTELMRRNQASGGMDEFPTALICHNDLVAMGIAENAAKDGVIVPRDLSLIGFDDVSVQYRFTPALTSIALPLHDLGVSAVQVLNELGAGDTGRHIERVCPVKLVVRESTRALQSLALAV